jgi:hypothetical protein
MFTFAELEDVIPLVCSSVLPTPQYAWPLLKVRTGDAETVLGVVVGYSLDESCQHFPGIRLRTHEDHPSSRFTLASRLLIRFRG